MRLAFFAAGSTKTRQLDGSVVDGEAVSLAEAGGRVGDDGVLRLNDCSAAPADEELTSMRMVGMAARQERFGRLEPVRETHFDQEVEASIGAGGCHGRVARAH